ncbi:MAG: MarR family winged helix-turn-helix transcriptional regulator [Solirubrobacteraceae bacterium]
MDRGPVDLVGHLEARGYVERVPNPRDRRTRFVRTTPRGRDVYAVVRELVAELEDHVASRLGRDRVEELRTLLADLLAALPDGGTAGRG